MAYGMKSTPTCMPHHSGGDNATKVLRRSTCRNSFRDIFLHDPSLVISSTPWDSKCYRKTHDKQQQQQKTQLGFTAFCNSSPKLWNSLSQTVREADSSATFPGRLKTHLFSDWLSFSVSAGLTVHRNLSMSSQDFFLCFYLGFPLKKVISSSALGILVNGTKRCRKGHHHHFHHPGYGYSQRKKKNTSTPLPIIKTDWRFVTKKQRTCCTMLENEMRKSDWKSSCWCE